jgi:hypothetical protein
MFKDADIILDAIGSPFFTTSTATAAMVTSDQVGHLSRHLY